MKKKIIFQIIIFLIILILSTFVYYKYLKIEKIDKKIDDSESILKDEKVNDSELVQESDKNIIENIKYFKEDIYGNKFTLKAKKGEITQNESKFVLLSDVNGVISLKNKSEILIYSKFAKYDSINFNTEFYTDVKASYENNVVRSENLDLFFKDNYGEMYNNIEFYNNDSKVVADKIFFDLANGDIKINMYNENNKVSIIKN
tara:strand:+ start:952 stop:1557 length:606 start_codon:yes stop_codon:yes gene_type:complete